MKYDINKSQPNETGSGENKGVGTHQITSSVGYVSLHSDGKPIGQSSLQKRDQTGGLSIEALTTELAPPKRLNTEDYEYVRQLETTRRRNELLRKMEQEKEIKEFRKSRISQGRAQDEPVLKPVAIKPTISKEVSRLIKLKPKEKRFTDN